MTHTPETQRAALQYAINAKDSFILRDPQLAFFAGYDYRQKEIDELVDLLEYAKKAIESVSSMGATTAIIERIDNRIQKHKR